MALRAALTIILTLALLGGPLAAEAQPARKVYRIAIVAGGLPVAEMTAEGAADPGWRAFFVELQRLGYVEGQNLCPGTLWNGLPCRV
jgi:putative ABC transport system substrate-binding protein